MKRVPSQVWLSPFPPSQPGGDLYQADAVTIVVHVVDGYVVEAWGRLAHWRAEVEA